MYHLRVNQGFRAKKKKMILCEKTEINFPTGHVINQIYYILSSQNAKFNQSTIPHDGCLQIQYFPHF